MIWLAFLFDYLIVYKINYLYIFNLFIYFLFVCREHILNNSSLVINIIWGLRSQHFHEYSYSIGKRSFIGWEVGHKLNKEPVLAW